MFALPQALHGLVIARVDEELEAADSLEGNYLPGANLLGRAQECSVSFDDAFA